MNNWLRFATSNNRKFDKMILHKEKECSKNYQRKRYVLCWLNHINCCALQWIRPTDFNYPAAMNSYYLPSFYLVMYRKIFVLVINRTTAEKNTPQGIVNSRHFSNCFPNSYTISDDLLSIVSINELNFLRRFGCQQSNNLNRYGINVLLLSMWIIIDSSENFVNFFSVWSCSEKCSCLEIIGWCM